MVEKSDSFSGKGTNFNGEGIRYVAGSGGAWKRALIVLVPGIFLMGVVVLLATFFSSSTVLPPTPITPEMELERRRREEVEMGRLESEVTTMMSRGVFQTMDEEGRLYVGPSFYQLTFLQRENAVRKLASYVAAKNGKPGGGMVVDLHDAYSGRRVYSWDGASLRPR